MLIAFIVRPWQIIFKPDENSLISFSIKLSMSGCNVVPFGKQNIASLMIMRCSVIVRCDNFLVV